MIAPCSEARIVESIMAKHSYKGLLGTQCAGKRRYVTLEFAQEQSVKMSEKYGKPMRVYYCGICRGHHLTGKSL